MGQFSDLWGIAHGREKPQSTGVWMPGETEESHSGVDRGYDVAAPRASSPGSGDGSPAFVANPLRRATWRVVPPAVLFTCIVAMLRDIDSEYVGLLAIVMMLTMMMMKMPIAVAMIVPGILGIYAIAGWAAAEGMMRSMPYGAVASWSLSVLAMFVFMGLLLWRSGVSERLYISARQWIGWVPGGLAVGTNFAGAGLAAVSGSTIGTTYALARIGIPEMLKAGYDRRLAVGSVLMAGTGGQLIPPSILLVVYAGVAEVPVGPQLLAGLLPGILLAVLYGCMIFGLGVARGGQLVGAGRARIIATWSERFRSLRSVWTLPVLALLVIGGMYTGVMTATEAGAAGAFGALLITLWVLRKGGFGGAISEALSATTRAVAAIFFLVIGAQILARLLAISGLARNVATHITELGLGRIQFLLLMVLVYLILGMFMEPISMMLLTVPILMPTLAAFDISLLWFGVFVVFLGELAMITPPVGILTFIVHGIAQESDVNLGTQITLGDTFRGVLWFLPISVVLLIIMIVYPDFVLWIPDRM
jgi:C4-dicarboxylate transporter, DctM subunit